MRVRAEDLDLRELLDFDPKGGVIRFAGQRALLLDADALGLLRLELIGLLGTTGARSVLHRFGYAHGWRTAEMLKDGFPWDNDDEWRRAGGRLHRLQGLVLFEPLPRDGAAAASLAQAEWRESYEADQHLLHIGQASEPVCWTLTGFASGYLSRVHGRQVYCIEERCRGMGDPVCLMAGRPVEEWEPERRAEIEALRKDCPGVERFERLTALMRRAERKIDSQRRELRARNPEAVDGIVARSEPMRRVLDLAQRVALVDTTLLLTGESGVGKELLARFVHEHSTRSARPFLALNCAAVPEGLLESELFGHKKGSFTGASQDRAGLFEAANGGTLLLDEVGELPLTMQAKLLRALQEREVRRVGENASRGFDVRLIAATNRELAQQAALGRFRQDLLYRLRVIEIRVPPLRERPDDVLPLARLALSEVARRTRSRVTGFTPQAADQLLRYGWPGNVRELQNVVERAVVLARGTRVLPADLPDEVRAALPTAAAAGPSRRLEDVEREYVLAVLERLDGNRARAAAELGIGAATLFRKLKKWAAPAPPRRHAAPRRRPR